MLVAVGTFRLGFDELLEAADRTAHELGLTGFAQRGWSRYEPRHLAHARFLEAWDLHARIAAADIVVCHGGMGLLGDAMRAGRRIVALPRRGATTADHPANDQGRFLARLAQLHPIVVAETAGDLGGAVRFALDHLPPVVAYDLGSDIPRLVRGFLTVGTVG